MNSPGFATITSPIDLPQYLHFNSIYSVIVGMIKLPELLRKP